MSSRVLVLLGTNKGAFVLERGALTADWLVRGPYCDGWPINHVVGDPSTGTLYAAGGNRWTGTGVWRGTDLGHTWHRHEPGALPPFGDAAPHEAPDAAPDTVFSLALCHDRLYAGTRPAALYESRDGGESFTHLAGLRAHPSRDRWMPGGAGLILHSIVPHPDDPDRIWVGISAAGVFATQDGGNTWEPRNEGTRADFMPEDQRYPEVGQCVHSVVRAHGADELLYQQNHCGMYRSADGGRQWQSIEDGLPSSFGFPVAAHPRDPGTVWLLPLNGDTAGRYPPDAALAVWRSRDGGDSWQALREGLPQTHAYGAVLRQAMAVDKAEPAGVYFGTNGGTLYASPDEGDSWEEAARNLPMILSVETITLPV